MELCRMPAAALASFDPMSVRDVLRPIGLALAEHFGFQVAQEHDNGKIVHSNLDNQIEHLTFLLKWRMDRTNEEDPQMALWRATDDLHHKALENFRRWVKYVNLQQINARDKNHGDTDIESESWISVSALSGSAWEFFGMWGFTSDINESSWVCNAQLHQLMLWYLIWGEASNLRFAPELLCFLFYCMSNALLLSTESGTEVRELITAPESCVPREANCVHCQIAILADDADLLKTSGDNGFLNFIITPIYNFLEHEGFRMGNGGACAFVHPLCTPQLLKQANKPIAERVMYDDVNETFWSIESVHSLLPAGCAHVGGAGLTVEPGVPRRAYGHFQRLLRESSRDDDPITSLKVYFKKTYCEFINVTWSVKRGNNTSVDGKSDSKKRSESLLGFLSKVYHKEIAQVFFFCLFPVFYVVENIVNGRWSENTCPTPDEFCANEVEHGVPFETFPRCIAPTGLDLLLTYCGDCLRDPPGSPFKCELLGSFASECIAACNDLVNYDPIFQVIALIYTIVIVGSTAIFWRPGSLMEMIWDSMSAAKKKTDLGASYVATPELLQVPLRKALLYNLIWLLSIEQMDPKNLPDGDLEPSVEARSAQWQRWARVWNEIVRNLRERDLLSNLERDELLFFMLREPEHAAFFGTPEYIVFPSMMTAPVFYTSLWRHGLSVRDLLAWLLISLGLVEEGKRATLVATLAGLAKQTARLMSSWKSTDVVQLVAVRNHLISLLVLLQRISSDQLTDSPSPTDDTSPDVKDQTPPSAGQAGAVPMSEDDQEYSNEVAIQLVVVLDSVKDLISGCSDEMATVGLHDDDYVVTLYRRFRALISLAPLESPQGWQQACTTLRSRACAQVLQALHLSLTSANPGAEPTNDEARRQLLFFCNSLRNATMPHAVPRIRLRGDSGDPVPYQALKTWCSDRGQLLSRTVRGVMLYADALRIQARLEQVPEEEIEALVASKFEYVVSSQNFYKLATSDIPESQQKAHFIDELRKQFPHSLRIAYVDEKDGVYSSVLLRDDSETRENIVIKVRLPGNPIIGEGKPENQNHAIIFTRGEYMQTLDMNQDGYLAEALKLRNMLGCFKGNIRIVGCREHIFSKDGGTIAAFAASTELVFGTTFQRFMTDPLCVRFHYGHPDVWDKQWVVGNGGVSKASRTLHLSEDIFGGINCIVRGGAVDFVEFVQVGKGRDMSFIGVNGFEQKISAGNALQCTTRDFYRLARRKTREQWAIHSENLEQSDLGKFSLSSYEGIWLLLQLSLLSLVFTLWLEKGLLFAVRETTRAYHFGEALVHGRGSYVATGRGYSLEPGKFVDLYKQYAQSHFYHGIETFSLILLFYLFTASTFGGWSVALYIISLLFSSMLFNPQECICVGYMYALSVSNIKRSFSELQLWLLSTDDGDTWASWHTKRLRLARNSTLPQKIG
ncbi:MAG: hypothetical protein SGPRY_000137 [Prymnesium sp.]